MGALEYGGGAARPMNTMRSCLLLTLALIFLLACQSTPRDKIRVEVDPDTAKDSPAFQDDDATRLVRQTHRNVQHYMQLRGQGKLQESVTMHRTVARAVDADFDIFREMAQNKSTLTARNMAVTCLGFSVLNRVKARDALITLLDDDHVWIKANAALGLSILRHKETDLTHLIRLLGHGDTEVRTNAATALRELFLVRETPRELTPEHWAAIDGLVSLLNDPATPRGRRAAVWALTNLRHPDMLPHLIVALNDDDERVQVGALRGMEILGDQRALEPLLEYLDGSPTTAAQSYARRALVAIAVQGGFAKTPAELDALGTRSKLWRKWFRNKRNE